MIRQQVRHESKDMLEKLTDTSLLLSMKLASSISLDAFSSPNSANTGKKLKSITISSSSVEDLPLYIAPLTNDK